MGCKVVKYKRVEKSRCLVTNGCLFSCLSNLSSPTAADVAGSAARVWMLSAAELVAGAHSPLGLV